MTILHILRRLLRHPLGRRRRAHTLGRFLAWQIGSRLVPGPVLIDWVNGARLIVRRSMTGATTNLYVGLDEYHEMAFLLHLLRPGDLFVDVGANVGVYSVLAGAAVGANALAIEPVPATFDLLQDNLRLNRLEERVRSVNVGVGETAGVLHFSAAEGAENHVATDGRGVAVAVETLDALVGAAAPTLIKIDVEGYETPVIAGAAQTLARPSLLAVILELNGAGARYGWDEQALHRRLLAQGFTPCRYDPDARVLTPDAPAVGVESDLLTGRNIIYVRDMAATAERLRRAAPFAVLGMTI